MKLKNIKPALLVFAFLIVGSFSFFAIATENLAQGSATFNDSDKDGLSDDEEKIYGTDVNKADTDGDGYSDGVEIKSGYDPLKAAPGDKIVPVSDSIESSVLGESTDDAQADEENVTSQLSGRLVEFIKENEGKTGEISVDNLDTIIEESIGDKLAADALPEVADSAIKIKKQDYASLTEEERAKREREDAMNYITSALYIMISNSPIEINSNEDVDKFTEQILAQAASLMDGSAGSMGFFDDLADRGQLILTQMNELEVPEKLVPTHKKGLQLAQYSIELKGKIKIDINDPMGLVVSLSKVKKVVEQGASFYLDALSELKKYGIGATAETATASTEVIPATTAPVTTSATTAPATTSGVTAPESTSDVQ